MSGRNESESERYPPHRPDGSVSLPDRLRRIEKWQAEHDSQDDERHEAVMERLNKLDVDRGKVMGIVMALTAISCIIGCVGTAVGIYVAIWK